MKPLRIGIDFDNTIVSYNGVFHKVAVEKKLILPEIDPSKGAVRDYLRSTGREDIWTELQGYVYGARMDLAKPYEEVEQFFSHYLLKQIPLFIISHKTKFPFLGPKYDLHQASQTWLQAHALDWVPAFFELTLEAKLERISKQKCTVFIDDLPELLAEKIFPLGVMKILFDPDKLHSKKGDYFYATSWTEIIKFLNTYAS